MIAEATIREALDAWRAEALSEEGCLVQVSDEIDQTFVQLAKDTARTAPPAGSLFEACVEAALMAPDHEHIGIDVATQITRAVIQTLIDRTESPTTCAELTRILAGVV